MKGRREREREGGERDSTLMREKKNTKKANNNSLSLFFFWREICAKSLRGFKIFA